MLLSAEVPMKRRSENEASSLGLRYLIIALATIAFAMLSGCSTLSPEDSEAWRASQQKVLAERAEARWKALIERDFESAYQYQSPAYRAVVSLQQFRAGYGGSVAWREVRVKEVEYDEPTSANVMVGVEYSASMVGGGGYKSIRVLAEKWLYSDGKWWYVSVR